jgi:asparagine synthetase B (glutamine-hydrolysing)
LPDPGKELIIEREECLSCLSQPRGQAHRVFVLSGLAATELFSQGQAHASETSVPNGSDNELLTRAKKLYSNRNFTQTANTRMPARVLTRVALWFRSVQACD